jgi:hypothetical protein
MQFSCNRRITDGSFPAIDRNDDGSFPGTLNDESYDIKEAGSPRKIVSVIAFARRLKSLQLLRKRILCCLSNSSSESTILFEQDEDDDLPLLESVELGGRPERWIDDWSLGRTDF